MNQQLIDSTRDGDLAGVQQVLQNGADVNDDTLLPCSMTALHLACWYGHLDVVQYLLTFHDANLEATDSDGWTLLHFACDDGHFFTLLVMMDTLMLCKNWLPVVQV